MSTDWLNEPSYLAALSNSSSTVITSIHSPFATLVPSDYFETGCEEFVCETTFGKANQQYYLSDLQAELNLHVVYQLPQKLFNVLIELFPTAKIIHQVTANLTAAKVITPENANSYLAVFCESNYLHLVAFQNGELIFSNQFEIQTHTDCMYFTLATVEKLKFQQEPIVGFNVGVHPKYWEQLQSYYANCTAFENQQLFEFTKDSASNSTHFLNLLCA